MKEEFVFPKVPKDDYGVHQTHCCVLHGCKYGEPSCPVVIGILQQEYRCEFCGDDWMDEPLSVEEQWNKIVSEFKRLNRELKLNRITDESRTDI